MGDLQGLVFSFEVRTACPTLYHYLELTTLNFFSWIDDAEFALVNASIPDCSSCKVHHGFKACNDATIGNVTSGVKNLLSLHPDYRIIVTGHSLGGAVATLASISLIRAGLDVLHYSCGSPRVGNTDFASYTKKSFKMMPQRITHYKDIVPHTPYESLGYVHIVSEVFEDENHSIYGCEGPSDNTCAEQFQFYQSNVNDHMLYFNHSMHCDS